MITQEYSCGFMIDSYGMVALVEKTKPSWQAGLLNGIGGKTEPGETPFQSMRREFREETGVDYADWEHICSLILPDARVDFFRAWVEEMPSFPDTNDSGERIVLAMSDLLPANIIPNLRWLVPLCLDGNGRIGGALTQDRAA